MVIINLLPGNVYVPEIRVVNGILFILSINYYYYYYLYIC